MNQPVSAHVWDGFEKFQTKLPVDIVQAHPLIADFVDQSKAKVDEIDDIVKDLRAIRTSASKNMALAIQARKRIEASPTWLNRHNVNSRNLPPPPKNPNTLANVVTVLEAIKKSPALDAAAAQVIIDAIAKIAATQNAGHVLPTDGSPVKSPVRKKTKFLASLSDSDDGMDMDPTDMLGGEDHDSCGVPFGASSAPSSGPVEPAPKIQKKKKKKKHN